MNGWIVLSVLLLSIVALSISIKATVDTVKLKENYENEVDFYSYCVQQALDNNVLDRSLVPMACANQDGYVLSSGVFGNQM